MALPALELQGGGHDVVLGVSPNLVAFGERAGLATLPFGPRHARVHGVPAGAAVAGRRQRRGFMKALTAISRAHHTESRLRTRALTEGADLVVAGLLAEDLTGSFCEAAGIPARLVPKRALPPHLRVRGSAGQRARPPGPAQPGHKRAVRAGPVARSGTEHATTRRELACRPTAVRRLPGRAAAGALELQAYSSCSCSCSCPAAEPDAVTRAADAVEAARQASSAAP